ncbi:glycine betaine ABC transporter substrate-binding protein [Anaerohalosphaera lusitana]
MTGTQEGDQKKDTPTVELVYVEWSSEVASTNVVRAVLQEVMGYETEITPVSAAAMWESVGTGDMDGLVAAWLPTTHSHYLENNKDTVVDLGANLVGTKIGLVVPDYAPAQSIEDLKLYADQFDRKIIGIDPGAGIMSKTETAMEEYSLDEYELVEGSGATMTGALANAIANEESIVVTGWTPHWKFTRWDLRYLQDPKNVYGGAEEIHTIVRKGLKDEMPKVEMFLDQFKWEPADMQELMNWNKQESKPYENAKKWIKENPEMVLEWVQGTGFEDQVDEKLAAIDASDAVQLEQDEATEQDADAETTE